MKISFDFDGTLEIPSVQLVAKALVEQGYDVCVLTTRYEDPSRYEYEVSKNMYDMMFDIAERAGITEINFTNFEWKYKTIDDLGIDIHIDDNYRDEVCTINHKCKAKAILFKRGWEKKLYETIKELS